MAPASAPLRKRIKLRGTGFIVDVSLKHQQANYNNDVTVLVGPEKTRFTLHEGILMSKSDFFRAALSGSFKESKEKLVRHPEEGSDVFGAYMQWIYTAEVVVVHAKEGSGDVTEDVKVQRLAELYILGDVLQDIRRRNAVVDEVWEVCDGTDLALSADTISFIYKGLTAISPLRQLVLMSCLCHSDTTWMEANRKGFPRDLLFEMARASVGVFRRGGVAPDWAGSRRMGRCAFHEHNEDVLKCSRREEKG